MSQYRKGLLWKVNKLYPEFPRGWYLVVGMSISIKKDTAKTNIKHNNRTMNENEKARNSHIDFSCSHKNKYLLQDDIRDLYKREFNTALENYNAKQKRTDRKIDNYYKHIQQGKKTSAQQEMIIQVGGQDDFKENEANREMANEILEEWFKDFQERNPQLKIYNATIHNDEASPHMHLNFVPVAEGYKRGLERQVAFDRAIKQQDGSLDKDSPFKDWRDKEVAFLEEKINERGIEREMVGTNEFKDVNDFKAKIDELKELEGKIDHARSNLESVQAVKDNLNIITAENEEKRSIGSKIGFKGKESVIMPKENYDKLYAMASRSYFHMENAMESKRSTKEARIFLRENEVMYGRLEEKYRLMSDENRKLSLENKLLHKSIDFLKDRYKDFSKVIGYAKAQANSFFNVKIHRIPEGFYKKDEQEGKREFIHELKSRPIERKKSRDMGL